MPPSAFQADGTARALLVFLCLALYVPGLASIPPVDRDEPRFAQATKQMLASGDFIRPHFLGQNRFKKPIGIYWLQSASVVLTGQRRRPAIWAYRLPSLIGAVAAVLLSYGIGRRLFGANAALLGAALLAVSVSLVVDAHLATTDAVLLACVAAAQGALAAIYGSARRRSLAPARYAAGFWIAQGAGILVKGPVVPLVSGLTVATLVVWDWAGGVQGRHQWRRGLHWAWGIPLMLLVILPWGLAVGLSTEWTFYRDWIGGDLLPKVVGGHESHGAPPGSYLMALPVSFWPGSLVVGLGIAHAFRRRGRYAERFCLAWLVPTWLFFELMPTKLPHYVLPTYPALALLTARAALAGRAPRLWTRAVRCALVLWGLLTVAMGIAIAAGTMVLGDGLNLIGVSAAVVAAAIGVVCVGFCWWDRPAHACWAAVGGSVVLFALTFQWALPGMHALWLSHTAAVAVAQHARGQTGIRPLATTGYQEPSLVFLAGSDVAFVDPRGAARFLRERPDGLALVSNDQQAAFTQAAQEFGLRLRPVWSTDGFNYSKGRWVHLQLFEQTASLAEAGESPE